jgi:hypothetical protein
MSSKYSLVQIVLLCICVISLLETIVWFAAYSDSKTSKTAVGVQKTGTLCVLHCSFQTKLLLVYLNTFIYNMKMPSCGV